MTCKFHASPPSSPGSHSASSQSSRAPRAPASSTPISIARCRNSSRHRADRRARSRSCRRTAARASSRPGSAISPAGDGCGPRITCASPASPRRSAVRSRCPWSSAACCRSTTRSASGCPTSTRAGTTSSSASCCSTPAACPTSRRPTRSGLTSARSRASRCRHASSSTTWPAIDLVFPSGSRYEYSNTENILVGLMVEAATGHSYVRELGSRVIGRLGLRETTLPSGYLMPRPFIHGYDVTPGEPTTDDSEIVAAGYTWASGGIVSTPLELNRFARAYAGGALFDGTVRDTQLATFIAGDSRSSGAGYELGRARHLPLRDRVRHGLRPHRQHLRLHAVHGGDRRRYALGRGVGEPADERERPRRTSTPRWRTRTSSRCARRWRRIRQRSARAQAPGPTRCSGVRRICLVASPRPGVRPAHDDITPLTGARLLPYPGFAGKPDSLRSRTRSHAAPYTGSGCQPARRQPWKYPPRDTPARRAGRAPPC